MISTEYDIAIICDGDEKYGYGHIRRSQTLYQDFQQGKLKVAIHALSEKGKGLLGEEARELVSAKVYLVDTPYPIDEIVTSLQLSGKVVGLDYRGTAELSHGIYTFIHPEQHVQSTHSSGFEYCIIRQDFKRLDRQSVNGNEEVLVAIGGADVNNQSVSIANHLHTIGAKVSLVLGPLTSSEQQAQLNPEVKVVRNPANFAQLINQSDWVVCNGGGTLFESRFLGKPCYVVPQTDAEQRVAKTLSENGEILGLGFEHLKSQTALFDIETLRSYQTSCIDGLGTSKILQILMEVLCQKNG